MHTAVQSIGAHQPHASSVARVAIAGATGYAGQELLRLLARHPLVTITAAMSSGAPGVNGAERRLPALARLWRGDITPPPPPPVAPPAERARGLGAAGVRVVDLSAAFRRRDTAVRPRWYPETHRLPDG